MVVFVLQALHGAFDDDLWGVDAPFFANAATLEKRIRVKFVRVKRIYLTLHLLVTERPKSMKFLGVYVNHGIGSEYVLNVYV